MQIIAWQSITTHCCDAVTDRQANASACRIQLVLVWELVEEGELLEAHDVFGANADARVRHFELQTVSSSTSLTATTG